MAHVWNVAGSSSISVRAVCAQASASPRGLHDGVAVTVRGVLLILNHWPLLTRMPKICRDEPRADAQL
jgi:hypothetical protein